MLRPRDMFLALADSTRWVAMLEILGRAQQWKAKLAHDDSPNLMAGGSRAIAVGLGERVHEPRAPRIRVPVDHYDTFRLHAREPAVARNQISARSAGDITLTVVGKCDAPNLRGEGKVN